MRLFKLLGFCLLLNACVFGTSQNAKFYTLSSVQGEIISKKYTSFVGINRVSLPKYMDRPQIVTQEKDSVEVTVSEYNRWIESPTVLATRVLTENLSTELPSAQVKATQYGTEKFDATVSVEVIRMDGILGNKAELVAWYTIKGNSGKVLARQKFTKAVEIGKSYDDLAKGYSQLWMELSQQIARSLIK